MEESTPSFGYWVRRQRMALDLTQADLARRVGCAPVTIRKIEADERRPSRQLAKLLAEHLAILTNDRPKFIQAARGDLSSARMPLPRGPVTSPELGEEPTSSSESLADQADSLPPPFVARDRELAALYTHFQAALSGEGHTTFVIGEAGRGKSTLLAEFARRMMAAHPDLIVIQGNCNAFSGMGDPYLPFRDAMSMLIGDVETRQGAGPVSAEHARRLSAFRSHAREALTAEGVSLIHVFFPNKPLLDLLQKKPLPFRGEQEQLLVFDQYTHVLHTLSRQRPIILLLDDLQWSDSASLSLLFHLGMRLAGARLLIVGAYRSSDLAVGRRAPGAGTPGAGHETHHPLLEMVNEFRRRFGEIQIDLGERQSEEGRGFVEAWLDTEPNRLGPTFREALFRRTQGHPLFTIELLRAMQERGDIFRDEENRWVPAPALNWDDLPVRVEAVIDQRIGRLDSALREILSVASVEGEVFTIQVIALIQNMDERILLHLLADELETRHQLVREHSEVEAPEGVLTRFRFGHVLFQEYLYNRLSRAERRLLHRQIAHALEELYGETSGEVVPQLAHHFRLAGEREPALRYTRQAVARAEAMHAYDQAVQELHFALDLIPPGEHTETRRALLEQLADDYALFGDRPRALSIYERALDLWHTHPDTNWTNAVRLHRKIGEMVVYMTWYKDRLRFAQTGQTSLQAGLQLTVDQPPHIETARLLAVLATEAWYPRVTPDWEAAEHFAREAVAVAEQVDSPEVLSAALDALANVYGGRGEFRERLEVAQRRLILSRDVRFQDPRQRANILQQTGFAYIQVGEYREALPYLFEAEEISAQVQALDQQARALRHQATCWFRLDEWEKVLELETRRRDLEARYPNFSERVGPT